MLSKRIILVFCLMLILTAGCGIFEPRSSKGTLNIIMVKNPQSNEQVGKLREERSGIWQIKEKLSNAQCIILRDTEVEYKNPLRKEDDYFHARIACLEPGENYSVFLYGKETRSYRIVVSAHQPGIAIQKGKETTIDLSWSLFKTTLNTPATGDTVTSQHVNLEWNPVTGAKGYCLLLDDDNDFSNPIIDERIESNQISIPFESFPEGNYYWKIQCIGSWVVSGVVPSDYRTDVARRTSEIVDREGHWSDIASFVFKKQP